MMPNEGWIGIVFSEKFGTSVHVAMEASAMCRG
jgi:hypothetical protein